MSVRKFVVWCHHRTGSTHLTSLLDSHPDVACWPELFFAGEGEALSDYYLDSEVESTGEFLSAFYSYDWGPSGANLPGTHRPARALAAIGFKLKYGQVQRYPDVLDYLRRIQDELLIVHLRRMNVLASLVSERALPLVSRRFGRPNVKTAINAVHFSPRVTLDPATIVDELEALCALVERSSALVEQFEVVEITYEDLIKEPPATLSRIAGFLGVSHEPELRTRYQKIMPAELREVIANADQIASALAGTRFSTLISE